MRNELILAQLASDLWALQPEYRRAMEGVLMRWSSGAPAAPGVMQKVATDRAARNDKRQELMRAGGGGSIAVIPLTGVITQRGNMVADISGPGSSSTQQLAQSIREAIADPSIAKICIVADSPGGSVYGISELCADIMQARTKKPIVGIADSLAASAAYWILAACGEVYVTPGGEVGSIGVWQAHQDVSQAMQKAGIKTTLISAGKFKTEGNQYEALDASAQDYLQGRVNDYYQMFVQDVARGRSTTAALVKSRMGQGRVLGAGAALMAGMVDGIRTFDQVIEKMSPNRPNLAAAKRELTIIGLSDSAPMAAAKPPARKATAADRAAFLRKEEIEIREFTRRYQ